MRSTDSIRTVPKPMLWARQFFGRTLFLSAICMLGATIGCSRGTAPQSAAEVPIATPPERSSATAGDRPTPDTPPPTKVSTAASPPAEATADHPVPSLDVWPRDANLAGPGDGVQLCVTRRLSDGMSIDVTRECQFALDPPGNLTISPTGYVEVESNIESSRALGARLLVRHESDTTDVKLTIGRDGLPVSDFALDIVPLLTKAGCASGACHGSAQGRGGLRLSLFGYDPEADFAAIARDHEGRRVDRADPTASLVLLKPSLQLPHGGGLRLQPLPGEFERLRRWVDADTPFRDESRGRLKRITVTPMDCFLPSAPATQQLSVVAEYADGVRRDVTRLCLYVSNDPDVAEVDKFGLVQLKSRGQVDVVVRFAHLPGTVRLSAPLHDVTSFDFAKLPARNFIDARINARLMRLRVPPSPRSSDSEFLRRIALDIIGLLPSVSETEEFLADPDPKKRENLVARLLSGDDISPRARGGRSEFAAFWSLRFGDLLGINSATMGTAANAYKLWVRRQLEVAPLGTAAGIDRFVREILLADGKLTGDSGPAAYFAAPREPEEIAEEVARRFLGVRVRCARCHDHPLDVWTQDDYFGFAAYFGRVQVEVSEENQLGQIVATGKTNRIRHPRTGMTPPYKTLGGPVQEIAADDDPRKSLVDWMLDPENPLLSRMIVNWVWAHLMGRGLVEPVDDMRATNPASHPELLDDLARFFREQRYDLRKLIALIVQSETYQRSSIALPENQDDERLYSRSLVRPLGAYELADAIAIVTEIPNSFPGNRSPRDRAVDLNDPNVRSELLDNLGRCDRLGGCEVGRSRQSASLKAALQLVVGSPINEKLAQTKSIVQQWSRSLRETEGDDAVRLREAQVRSIYLRAFCRPPRAEERAFWMQYLNDSANLTDAYADMVWAVLNSSEFVFNH